MKNMLEDYEKNKTSMPLVKKQEIMSELSKFENEFANLTDISEKIQVFL